MEETAELVCPLTQKDQNELDYALTAKFKEEQQASNKQLHVNKNLQEIEVISSHRMHKNEQAYEKSHKIGAKKKDNRESTSFSPGSRKTNNVSVRIL